MTNAYDNGEAAAAIAACERLTAENRTLRLIKQAALDVIGAYTGDHPETTDAALKELARALNCPTWK